jgi:hypothetical protein
LKSEIHGHRYEIAIDCWWRLKDHMNNALEISLKRLVIASALLAAVTISLPRAAQADTSSTLAIAGAAAIVGALLIDGNNHPYYVNNNRRYYVSQDSANYYRSHHKTMQRRAYVPEREYPVANGYNYNNSNNYNHR